MGRLILFIGWLAIVIGLGAAGYGVWTIWNQHREITSARPVMATVLSHQTTDLKGGGFVAKVPLVKYEYTVDQQAYTSETVTRAELMLPNTWAETVFQQFPIGGQVQAYYDPNDPSTAFLIPKYSIKPYLPLLIGLVIGGIGLGVVWEQLTCREEPTLARSTSGEIMLVAKQHHLARARMLGMVGIVGLVCGGPAIVHHLLMSTAPHERMGFLMEGAYAIAVLVVLAFSAMSFRQGAGFGAPTIVIDRPPAIGQPLQLKASVPTRFNGPAQLQACLKCEAKDVRFFNFGEEVPDVVLVEQHLSLAPLAAATAEGELAGTAELMLPDEAPPSTPGDSKEPTHVVWTLLLTAEGDGGRKAETEYLLPVARAPVDQRDVVGQGARLSQPAAPLSPGRES